MSRQSSSGGQDQLEPATPQPIAVTQLERGPCTCIPGTGCPSAAIVRSATHSASVGCAATILIRSRNRARSSARRWRRATESKRRISRSANLILASASGGIAGQPSWASWSNAAATRSRRSTSTRPLLLIRAAYSPSERRVRVTATHEWAVTALTPPTDPASEGLDSPAYPSLPCAVAAAGAGTIYLSSEEPMTDVIKRTDAIDLVAELATSGWLAVSAFPRSHRPESDRRSRQG